jgi:type I restriction enzyme, R subunit
VNETETRAELIDPALQAAGWGVAEGSLVRRGYTLTPGRIEGTVPGKRGKPEEADYVLVYKGHKLAVIEAKKRDAGVSEGRAQAIGYAEKLKIRFAYSTNGRGLYAVDLQTGKEDPFTSLSHLPTPQALWELTYPSVSDWRERFATVPFQDKGGSHGARYYQETAVDRVLEAIAANKRRVLLTLATGTGKTFIAFQIAWKLFQSRWNLSGQPTRRPRVLFLADRNILADQAYNAFSAFPEDALVRIKPDQIKKKGKVPKNGSLFFTIFQTFMSGPKKDGKPSPYFGEYPPDFFDFIVIDECHRGGASDESEWRAIMEYFAPAVQLGLTATPRRTENANTYKYFGDPVYQYSLKEGINDGFLTPFKVQQIASTLDEYVYTEDDDLIEGEIEKGKRYEEKDFNIKIVIDAREKARVDKFMGMIDPNQKTLVFCATQDHAAAIRDYINQTKAEGAGAHYCERVTANDGDRGEEFLRQFQDNEKSIPTILTTSRKLSTGVDARNVRNIVLMRPIKDIVEFKQIIGRGTRLYDTKAYFTIYDFVKAHQHFTDPEWDGEPLEAVEDDGDEGGLPLVHEEPPTPDPDDGRKPLKPKIHVKLGRGKERTIQFMSQTTFWDSSGKPVSAEQFLVNLYGTIPDFFANEAELRKLWGDPLTREKLLEGLEEKGFSRGKLVEMQKLIDAEKSDIFDVLAYIAFEVPPETREERARRAKAAIDRKFSTAEQVFIDFVLAQYVKEGVDELAVTKLSPLLKLRYGAITDAQRALGATGQIQHIFSDFQRFLYTA